MTLNPRQERFVAGVLAGRPAADAYRAAGYRCRSGGAARANASRLLTKASVAAALADGRAAAREAAVVVAADVMRLLYEVATDRHRSPSASRVAALGLLARCLGMFHHPSGPADKPAPPPEPRDPRSMTLEELEAEIARLEAGQATGLAVNDTSPHEPAVD